MRLFEIVAADDIMYKGRAATPDKYDHYSFDTRISELKQAIVDWQKIYDKLPDKDTAYAHQTEYRINNFKQELADFDEIGELPFTFYAAKDREHAEYFRGQFEGGVIDEVRLTAKNLATVEDLRALGFGKQTVSHLTPIQIHKLKKAGFDGATGTIDNVGGEEVVVFSPEQVQRV